MLPEYIRESVTYGLFFAAGIIVFFVVLAATTNAVMRILARRYGRTHPDSLGVEVIRILRGPLELFFVLAGVFLGFVSLTQQTHEVFATISLVGPFTTTGALVGFVLILTYVLERVAFLALTWYLRNYAHRTETTIDDRIGVLLRRLMPVVMYAVGGLIALEVAGISISPLLAGLGIVGLAVALALQPTLGNFFAGTYVMSEGELHEGNYIELEGGPAGFVVDIGWRSTKIRSVQNNLVIIPNATMADSIITNYFSPTPVLTTIVECGVSYESDLQEVENIVLEIARDEVARSEVGYEAFEPLMRYAEFGDSNVNFRLIFQATDRGGSFAIKHEIMKRIHARFVKEGIEINYPVRKLLLPTADGREDLPFHVKVHSGV